MNGGYIVLGVDLGGNTGVAAIHHHHDGEVPVSAGLSSLNCGHIKALGQRYGDWLDQFDRMLTTLMESPGWTIRACGYEKVRRHKGVDAAHAYGAYEALVLMLLHKYDIPAVACEVGQIKKFATGKGNAIKERMVAAALAHVLLSDVGGAITEDQADAFWVACLTDDIISRRRSKVKVC